MFRPFFGGTHETQTQESELTRVWKFGFSMVALAFIGLAVLLIETMLLGAASGFIIAAVGLAVIVFTAERVLGYDTLVVGLALVAFYHLGLWWPFVPIWSHPNQWVQALIMVRALVAAVLAPAVAWPAWVIYHRFTREAALPMLSNAQPGRAFTVDGIHIPGVGTLRDLQADEEPATDPSALREIVLSIPHKPTEPEPVRTIGELDGEPAVTVGGSTNGNGLRLAALPLSLFKRSGEANAAAWDRLGVFAAALLDGAPLSRNYWTTDKGRGILTDPQYRAILAWLTRDHLARKMGPAKTDGHELTRSGTAALRYVVEHLEEYRALEK